MPKPSAYPSIPQVLSIVKVSRKRSIPLKKVARQHLGDPSHVAWRLGDEIHLEATAPDDPSATAAGRSVTLPEAIQARLAGDMSLESVALVERPNGAAIKRFELTTEPANMASVVDLECDDLLRRVVYTNPPPEDVLAELRSWATKRRLSVSLRAALADLATYEGWLSRQLLGWETPDDASLCHRLVEDRVAAQAEDGSWNQNVSLTARMLLELGALGAGDHDATAHGMAWMLERPESPHNPGMVFGYDGLVEQQVDVVARRQAGERARFRERRAQEMRLSRSFSELYHKPCGPRIMWPNAHVLQAALALGYEEHPRVQSMLETLSIQDWCECGYQHGTSGWRRTTPMTEIQVRAFEDACRRQYEYGGLATLDELARMDLTWPSGQPLRRTSQEDADGATKYLLERADHLQGCELMTTRALAGVADERLRRLAVAHLWRFAGRQDPQTGRFGGGSVAGYFHTPLAVLDTVSRYDEPIALTIMARALPDLIAQQRDDGLWGEGDWAPALTLVVARTLARLAENLPGELIY